MVKAALNSYGAPRQKGASNQLAHRELYAADDLYLQQEDAAEIAVRKSLHGIRGRKGMGKQDNELMETFRQEKLMPDETLEAHIKGWLDRKTGQGVIQHNGQFVLTNKRACFYSEAPFEEIFETIPLSKITSVETSSLMGYRVLRVHTAHDDLEFETLEPKDLFDNVVAKLERLRNQPTGDA